jgi:hypothetical protein
MKFGPRKPSLKKSLAARGSLKRALRHQSGMKAPRGWGWLTDPDRAAYNRAYYRTTAPFAFGGCVMSAIILAFLIYLLITL